MNTHSVTPIHLNFAPGKAVEVAKALDTLLKANGTQIALGGKTFALGAFPTPQEAEASIRQANERYLAEPLAEFMNADNCVWVSVTSINDPTLPAVLLREIVQSDEVLLPLLEACESPAHAAERAAFEELVTPRIGNRTALHEALTEMVLFEVKSNLRDELSNLPCTEIMDLSPRGDYVRDPFDVDPIETLLDDPYALSNAAHERNSDAIAEEESRAISSVIRDTWTNSAAEDLMPVLEALGHNEGAIEEQLRDWCQECTSHTGVVNFKLQGDCAITARPMLGKEGIYITFDGVTSSAYNAVVDADYLAMLDVLNIDVRGWVDHLATISGMEKPKWDIDLKGIVEGHLKDARFDPATGHHWESAAVRDSIRESLMHKIFNLPPEQSAEITQTAIDAAATARAAYREAIKNDAPEAEQAALKQAFDKAMEATREQPGEEAQRETAEYLFDIALESLIADAEALESAWLANHGVDLDALGAMTSSKEQLQAFPQIAESPNYYMALANLGSNGSTSYDWSNPPNATPTAAPLITNSNLVSILQNCNYSGNLVFAFSCDIDDLQKIGVAAQDDQPKAIRVDGAYLHIHDYNNGAGDGEPLSGVWTMTTEQLKNKAITLRNDTGNDYGIQGVFGQFLADRCGIVITEPKPHGVKRLEKGDTPELA